QALSIPGWVMSKLATDYADCQGQVPAQGCYLARRSSIGGKACPAHQRDKQRAGLIRSECIEANNLGVFQCSQPAAARDQDQTSRCARQKRPNVLVPGGVVKH